VTPASAAAGDTSACPEDAVEVGRIVAPWGVKGWVKVQPFARDPQALFASRRWFLKPPEASGPRRPASAAVLLPPLLEMTEVKHHGDGVVALAQGIGDRGAAEALQGARVFVSRANFPTPGADEFYWVDLIGSTVLNLQGEMLGTVSGLIDTGPHSVLRIVPEGADPQDEASQRLVPFVGAYVHDVNLADKRITVDWGLDY
jgi:16S rRNA processing protein RimM